MWSKLIATVLSNALKYSPLIVLSLVMLFVANLARNYYQDAQTAKSKYEQLVGQTQDYAQIKNDLARLEVEYKTEKQLLAQEEKDWANEKKNLQGQITALASATFSVPSFETSSKQPDLITTTFIQEEVAFHNKNGEAGPPFGYVKIINKTGETISGSYSAQLNIKAAVTRETDGRYHILTKGAWNMIDASSLGHSHPELHMTDWVNKSWPLDITGGEFWINPVTGQVEGSRKRFYQTLHLNFGGYAGVDPLFTTGLHGDISVWGYGQTKNDLDYKLLSLGVNISHNHFDVDIIPVKWRVGNVIPLIDDLYIGAGVGIGFPSTPTYFLSLDTTL